MNDNMTGELPPWDRGRLIAHRISAGPTKNVRRNLNKAQRDRQFFLTWFLPGRRRFLDGLISGLEETLKQREESSSRKKRDGHGSKD